jgi:hypothetical protein
LPVRESFVNTPEILGSRVDIGNWISPSPREKLGEELHDSDCPGNGISSCRVKSRFLIALPSEEIVGDAILSLCRVASQNPYAVPPSHDLPFMASQKDATSPAMVAAIVPKTINICSPPLARLIVALRSAIVDLIFISSSVVDT